MASTNMKQHPKRRGAAPQLTPLSHTERSPDPTRPAAVPDIPSPLCELPAEGTASRRLKPEFAAGKKNLGAGDSGDFAGKAGAAMAARVPAGRRGVKKGAPSKS
jgi:hypothetical protein